jgi:uncharacterized membrane protein YphA (DoxX/SURF4 family)
MGFPSPIAFPKWTRSAAVVFLFGCRLALGVLLLWSGLSKANHPYQFLDDVYGYHLVSTRSAALIAACLPYIEISIGVCLVLNLFVPGALLVSTAAFAVFTWAQWTALRHGLQIPCGCFGTGGGQDADLVTNWSILRTASLAAAGVCAFSVAVWTQGRARAVPAVTEGT